MALLYSQNPGSLQKAGVLIFKFSEEALVEL